MENLWVSLQNYIDMHLNSHEKEVLAYTIVAGMLVFAFLLVLIFAYKEGKLTRVLFNSLRFIVLVAMGLAFPCFIPILALALVLGSRKDNG